MEVALFNGIRGEILSELDNSSHHIRAAIAWFTNRHLFEKLCGKVREGKKVELIIIDDFINSGYWGLDFQHFINLGGHLYYGDSNHPMHHKFCVIDNHTMFNGSYNWTYYAESKNVENTIKIKDNPKLINQFINEFDSLKAKLEKRNTAIKRSFKDIDLIDLFSIRNYLAFDLLSKGQQENSVKPVEAAARILPTNMYISQEYNKISQQKIEKRTITSLGIECRINGIDGKFSVLIPKGTIVPYVNSGDYWTVHDNQTTISVETYKGDSQDCISNTHIGSFVIADLPPKPAGQAGMVVTFSLDKDGKLNVVAKNKDTNGYMEAEYFVGSLVF